jgi:hypothetical protein
MEADAENSRSNSVNMAHLINSDNQNNENNNQNDSVVLKLVMKRLNSKDPQQIFNTIVQVKLLCHFII